MSITNPESIESIGYRVGDNEGPLCLQRQRSKLDRPEAQLQQRRYRLAAETAGQAGRSDWQ